MVHTMKREAMQGTKHAQCLALPNGSILACSTPWRSAKKLDCLGFVAATIDSDKVEGGSYGQQTTELIDDGLVCVSAFRWLPAWSTETGVAFRALHRVLVGAAPHSTNDKGCSGAGELLNSTTFHHFQAMLVDMASEHRGLVPVIADFINRLLACTAHRLVGEQLLRTVDECLLPRLEPGYQLASYYRLFEKIAQNEAVPQLRLIKLLTKQMVSLAKKHDPDTELKGPLCLLDNSPATIL